MRFDEDPLLMRSQLVRTGTSDSEIRTATRNGTMKRIRRGAFADSSALQALGPEDRHVLRTRAHANAAGGRLVVSHQSAALVHGIALWAPDLQRVHFTVGRSGGGRKTGGRHVHPAPLEYLKPGQTPAAAVVAEKKREDALRAHGWIVLRLTWSDLENPDRLVSKLRASIELAAALPTPRTVVRRSAR
ncbi:hypothetical protein CH289_02095 [Rhodococcus sp. RS1C4]|uniref:hypothetical protein n=1 Tax=Rhodococcus sp. 114MFTsu3.1 TaxID=1172184 RepID=UPI000378FCA6|nr:MULTISPECIES: hypothetical protein [unclassified Rhodococcus (in: high G+C Gram-positive bacteria)]OZC58379.1 hypothetical protein CH289_02095 [Rhodococcus sp. RS1C4]